MVRMEELGSVLNKSFWHDFINFYIFNNSILINSSVTSWVFKSAFEEQGHTFHFVRSLFFKTRASNEVLGWELDSWEW